jgi:hypothetical protein
MAIDSATFLGAFVDCCLFACCPGGRWGTFVIVDFVINNNHSQRPCYGPLKLKVRHSDIYYDTISLLICFGHPPTTMDAVSATIVAGGRANIN